MTATALHDAEVAARFDLLADRFKATVDPVDYRLAAVLKSLSGLEFPTILDIGCGKGRFARQLESSNRRVIGIDLSSRMLAEAVGLPRARGNATRLPFKDQSFSAAIAIESIEHVRDIPSFIDEARRVLQPGGRLIVIDKNAWSLNQIRPWLPSSLDKWIQECRGRWMYPAGGPARECWFVPSRLSKQLSKRFEQVYVEFLLSPTEAKRLVFRRWPSSRLMVCWTAVAPGGSR